MSPSTGAYRLLFVFSCVVLGLCEAWAVFLRDSPAITIQGAHRRFADEFGEGARVSQAFQMVGNGLTEIAVQFSTDQATTLLVDCELSSVAVDPPAVGQTATAYNWTATIKRVSGVEWRRVSFPTIDASNRRAYMLRLQLLAATPVEGSLLSTRQRPLARGPRVAVVVSKDNVVGGGLLWIADQRQVGSLSLRAFTNARTTYGQFRADVAPALPSVLRNAGVFVGLAVAYQWALLTVVYALLIGRSQ